jgi:hypothetical protein
VWGRLDDSFWDHPKVVEAGNEAAGAVARMISYCSKHQTDGVVPLDIVMAICGRPGLVRELFSGLFLELFDPKSQQKVPYPGMKKSRKRTLEIRLHDFLDYNLSAEEWQEQREVKSTAGKKGAAVRWGKQHGTCHGKSMADPDPEPKREIKKGADESVLTLEEVGDQCFPRCGMLAGAAIATMKQLEPVYQHELDAALKTKGTSYGYLAKVIRSYREAASEPRSEGSPRRPKRVSNHPVDVTSAAIAECYAEIEAREAKERGK